VESFQAATTLSLKNKRVAATTQLALVTGKKGGLKKGIFKKGVIPPTRMLHCTYYTVTATNP